MTTPQAKDRVRAYFDAEVADYLGAYDTARAGDARHDAFSERREIALSMMPVTARRILDIGAGPGVFTRRLLDRGASCCVVDLSHAMMAAARQALLGGSGQPRFIVGDIEGLPFASGSFDGAFCVGVLQYLSAPEASLAELGRVMATGGQVIITFPNARSPLNMLHRVAVGAARSALAVSTRLGLGTRPDPSRLTFRSDIPNRWLSAAEIERHARASGFRVDGLIYHVLQFPFAVPGLGAAVAGWNRSVRDRLPTGPLAIWGREGIMRLVRE